MPKAFVYNPYFDSLGGGEKYVATVIKAYLNSHYQVDILWPDLSLIDQIKDRFNLDISQAEVNPEKYHQFIHGSLIKKWLWEANYDSCFCLSDGSIPLLFTRNNILHFQVPFHLGKGNSLINQIKLKPIHHIICNSQFTQKIIDQEYHVASQVIYPPVTMYPSSAKEKIILSVGRFDNLLNAKRQDVLIQAFKLLNNSDWKLVLIGGSLHGDDYVTKLKKESVGFNIEFKINASHQTIAKYYQQASIYWHATGFGFSEAEFPEKMEHFGISTVEAMSTGTVPLAYKAGGQKEIIKSNQNGYLWSTLEELIDKTQSLINDPKIYQQLSQEAYQTSQKYSQESFIHEFHQLIS